MDIQTGRFGRYVQALFNLKQRMTLGQALPDVMPCIDLERPRQEMEIHSGNFLSAGSVNVPAVVGEFGFACFRLPPASGRIAVLEEIVICCDTTRVFQIATGVGSVGTISATNTPLFTDFRTQPGQRAVCEMRTGSTIVSLTSDFIATRRALANTNVSCNIPFVLANLSLAGVLAAPIVVIEVQVTNQAFQVSYRWRERAIDSQESII